MGHRRLSSASRTNFPVPSRWGMNSVDWYQEMASMYWVLSFAGELKCTARTRNNIALKAGIVPNSQDRATLLPTQ